MSADLATLDSLCTLLESAGKVLGDIVGDPSVKRLLDAFARIPPKDRPVIAAILEREASLRELGDATADQTGHRLTRPNPQAHLYIRTIGRASDVSIAVEDDRMVSAAIEAAQRTPLLFQPDLHPRWRRAAEEMLAAVDPDTRAAVERLARELLELVAAVEPDRSGDPRRASEG